MWYGKKISLKELSFNVIVENFEQFFYASTVSENSCLQRNFKFLKRLYSAELARALVHKNGKLKDDYLEFLMNENLNLLVCEWFRNTRYRNSMEDIFCRIPNLKIIKFVENHCEIRNPPSCSWYDEVLKNVAKFCPKIVEIDANYVTDRGVQYLCRSENGKVPCPEIKRISIKKSSVSDTGADCLIRNLPLLESFDYRNLSQVLHRIHEENLFHFKKPHIFNLTDLRIGDINYPNDIDILNSCITVCPKLQSLDCNMSNLLVLNFYFSSHLKDLVLRSIDRSINIDSFLKINGCNLTSLYMFNCTISLSLLAAHCPVLKKFDVFAVNFIVDDDLQPVFSSLTELSFWHFDITTDKVLSVLFSCSPNLKYVALDIDGFSSELRIQILKWCKKNSVEHIHVLCPSLTLQFLSEILESCSSLKTLFVNCRYLDVDQKEIFLNVVKSLPYKPEIIISSEDGNSKISFIEDDVSRPLFSYGKELKEFFLNLMKNLRNNFEFYLKNFDRT